MHDAPMPGLPGKRGPAPVFILDEALKYIALGWRIFPVHCPVPQGCSCAKSSCSVGKHPRLTDWCNKASSDPATVKDWWTRWPDSNIGITTGRGSGICVLDVDGDVGKASLLALERTQALPQTLKGLTGRLNEAGLRSGFHLYFRLPPGVALRNSASQLGHGLDIRAEGGFVVAPPSLHASGFRYEWQDFSAPVAEMPGWLISKLGAKTANAARTYGDELLYKGARNDFLIRIGGACRRKGATRHQIRQRLGEHNQRRCHPPLEAQELDELADNAADYPVGGPDPLDSAWERVRREEGLDKLLQLLSIARHLALQRPGQLVALPQVRIAKLLQCDHTLISRYCRRLVSLGLLVLEQPYIKKRRAALYRVAPWN